MASAALSHVRSSPAAVAAAVTAPRRSRRAPARPRRVAAVATAPASANIELALGALGGVDASWAAAAACNSAVFLLGAPLLLRNLDYKAYAASWGLGLLSLRAFGAGGYAIVCMYFVLGAAVTKLKLKEKAAEGTAEGGGSGKRGYGSVVGSGAAGIAAAIAALLSPPETAPLWKLAYSASFCTKLADTTASEVGKAYGKTTYLSTTLQRVPRGTEGAVSLEGTLAGVAASVVLACLAAAGGMVQGGRGIAICVVAAFIANTFESVLGATAQGRLPWLTNDLVNVANITVGAVTAAVLQLAIGEAGF